MSAPKLHHSPTTELPKNPSWPLLELSKITELLISPPTLLDNPKVVGP